MENKISAKILLDSITKRKLRITTYELMFPRSILAELNTHRMFSKNSASSRAIPFEKMLISVLENPYIPIAFQKDHKGMQGSVYIADKTSWTRRIDQWLYARDLAVLAANKLYSEIPDYELEQDNKAIFEDTESVTKQNCNRLLEPFLYHTVLLTATEYDNFFKLRCPQYQTPVSQTVEPQPSWIDLISVHSNEQNIERLVSFKNDVLFRLEHNKGAGEIHIMELAEKMYDALGESKPQLLEDDEWHIPFAEDFKGKINESLLKLELDEISYIPEPILMNIDFLTQAMLSIATARCARLSYKTLGPEPIRSIVKDLQLAYDLYKMEHMSPFEHCAKAMNDEEYYSHFRGVLPFTGIYRDGENEFAVIDPINIDDSSFGWSRNFRGFVQYREVIENAKKGSERTS